MDLVDELLRNVPESWEASEGSAESIIIEYVRALEVRLDALAGPGAREPYPEDEDGAPLPDALTDPTGYAQAVRRGK